MEQLELLETLENECRHPEKYRLTKEYARALAIHLKAYWHYREQLEQVPALRAELAAARLEIEALRVKPWQEQIEGQSAVISRLRYEKGVAEAEAAELRAHVERLRKAFKRIITTDENGNSMTWPQIDEMVRPLLAAAPAQSLAKLRAETLWAAAMKISASGPYGWDDAVDWLTSEAERLQEEAANG